MELSFLPDGTTNPLETVKVLHETVLALRTALEGSKKEILELRNQNKFYSASETSRKHETLSREVRFISSMDEKENKKEEPPQYETKHGSESDSDDIDDIELVFTTADTDSASITEDLEPIRDDNVQKPFTSLVPETDISQCGVMKEKFKNLISRRNTLPHSTPYQPILHREVLGASNYKIHFPGTQENGAQTDITALPSHWRSETYLTRRMSCNTTTLPSRFTLPVPQMKRLPLEEKTQEARRVLLSDINFTSMVPELSRSADDLYDEEIPRPPQYKSSIDRYCSVMRMHSPCKYTGVYRPTFSSSSSISSDECPWKFSPICCYGKRFWSSISSSPMKCVRNTEGCFCPLQKKKPQVRFHDDGNSCRLSLPNLRAEGESECSANSLDDEAEENLRRSVDLMIISKKNLKKGRLAYSSDSNCSPNFEPPASSQPYLPKTVKDLKINSLVKVIIPGGKIAVGKVKYTGRLEEKSEPYVGVELSNNTGFSNGTFMGHRFFKCDTNHAVFVPFRKVVIAWNA